MTNNFNIELITYTPEPEKIVAAAAKLCYSPSTPTKLLNDLTPANIESFIKKLESLGHESPFEHISFTFGIEGVSRITEQQLTRHRIASYSIQSGRYVNRDKIADIIVPPTITEDSELLEEYLTTFMNTVKTYKSLTEKLKAKYINQGMKESTAEKKAIEDARYILPQGIKTNIIMTMNARSLFNFLRERTCNRAQWEIRAMAITMLKLLREVAPNIFRHAGPECLYSKCPEGELSCGNMLKVREELRAE